MDQSSRSRRPVCEALEARILYSADLGPLSLAAADLSTPAQVTELTQALSQSQNQPTTLELAVIDTQVAGADELIADIERQQTDRAILIVRVEAGEDGIAAVSEALADLQANGTLVSAIHLVGHGDVNGTDLGATRIDLSALRSRTLEFANWASALTADADLLLYGCDVAGAASGQTFVQSLAQLTGADVAASDDLTGAARMAGDWTLEHATGRIETGIVISESTQLVWDHVLATFTVTNTNDAGAGSLRQAITDANTTAGVDSIHFNIPTTDPNHVYYQDNATAGTFSAPLVTPLSDAAITDFDADYLPGTERSWYRITLGGVDLEVTEGLIIDGSTQPGYDAAKGPIIEINAAAVSVGDPNAITLRTGASTIRALVINRAGDNGIEVDINADGSRLVGNYLGTDVSGTQALGNGTGGPWGAVAIKADNVLVGGVAAADRNLISGNADSGIELYSSAVGAIIQGNYIGTTIAGGSALGNAGAGIHLHDNVADILIGGVGANQGNVIAFNGGDGIWVQADANAGNGLLGNSIYANTGLGIDLDADGVTANDPADGDTGANDLQNYPLLMSAIADGSGQLALTGALSSTANTQFRIEFFASAVADGSGHGEGQTYLGAITVTTDAAGRASFATNLTGVSVATGHAVSATATLDLGAGNYGSTSEFSVNLLANNGAVLWAGQDTFIKLGDTGLNYGAQASLVVDRESTDLQRALILFDLSTLPVNATITGATLQMQATQIGGALNLSVYEMLSAWLEGAGTGTVGTANWNQRASGIDWTSVGGDFNGTAVANLNISSTGQHSWDITALVQAWSDGSKVNNGLMVASQDGGGNRTVTYDSREGVSPPQLVISYTLPANTAPTLDASGNPIVSSISEDAGTPSGAVGTLVSALIDFAAPAGQLDNVTDPDAGALLGVAVTAADTANGAWFYSIDNGALWNALGAPTQASARLLAADANTRVYFQPNADFNGAVGAALTFRAWDQTVGVNGGSADTTVNAGASAFSSATDTAALVVDPINDAPVLIGASLVLAEGQTVSLTPAAIGVTDPDSANFSYAVSGATGGYFQFISAPGAAISTFTSAQLAAGLVRYVDDGNELAPAFDLTVNDGLADSNTVSVSITYTPVNDAPLITSATLSVNESQTVTLSAANFGIVDPDSVGFTYALSAIAGGYFQLSNAVATPITSFSSADLSAGLVQFVDDDNEFAPSFDVVVNDGFSDSNTLAATITYAAVNDSPTISVPAAQSMFEDGSLAFSFAGGNAIALADPDAAGSLVQLSLSVSNGTLSLAQSTNLVLLSGTGLSDTTIIAQGTPTDLNAALDGLIFQADADFNGPVTLDISIDDLGSGGSGAGLSASQSVVITVTAVNDAPSDLLLVPALTLAEGSVAGTAAGTVVAIDADDAGGFVFSLLDGAGQFAVDPSSGAITVAATVLPDAAVQPSYQISVRGTDPAGASIERSFTIQVARNGVAPAPAPAADGGRSLNLSDGSVSRDANSSTTPVSSADDSELRRMFVPADDDPSAIRRRVFVAPLIPKKMIPESYSGRRFVPIFGQEPARVDELQITMTNERGHEVLKRALDKRRLLDLLNFEDLRRQSDADGGVDLVRFRPILPPPDRDWEPVAQDAQRYHVVLESVQMGGAAVSIGLLFYALRAGGLVAAMLTALPAWSSMDLLAVLRNKDHKKKVNEWGDDGVAEMDQDEAAIGELLNADTRADTALLADDPEIRESR